MTNTYMLAGEEDPQDIVHFSQAWCLCREFRGGQVDITNGKIRFSASEAYLIEMPDYCAD